MPLLLRLLPKAAASRFAGRVARHRSSRLLVPWFARHYGVDTEAAAKPAGSYGSLQEFFCRELKPGARAVAGDAGVWVSPVDGRLGACGIAAAGELLQAKGRSYSLERLLGDAGLAAGFDGGQYCTLYLAPSDYHRVHSPAAATLTRVRRIPGTFWPVNPKAVAAVAELFATNERVVVELGTKNGPIVLVLVGACLVGSIQLRVDPPALLGRGEELGRFEFGSTVIMLSPPGSGQKLALNSGERVRMGEVLWRPQAQPVID